MEQNKLFFKLLINILMGLLASSTMTCNQLLATALTLTNLPDHGVLSPDYDGFLDPKIDYSKTVGRISDIDQDKKIFKIKVENDFTRFLKPGDPVNIKVLKLSEDSCLSHVVATELQYFTVQAVDVTPCWGKGEYLRRGLVLEISSDVLLLRVQQASAYRKELLLKRAAYLKQLSEVNNFFWNFNMNKEKLRQDYDQKLNQLKNEKIEAMNNFNAEQAAKTKEQGELMQELNQLDELLKYYRIDRTEILTDKFHADYDTSAPVDQRARVVQ